MRKNFHFCRNSLSPFSVAAMYFSISILSCTNEMKSLKTDTVLFNALIYRQYLPRIMRWLRVKRCAQGRVTPNKTSGSERSICALLIAEYQVWNLSHKEDACGQLINKWRIVWLSEGQKGQDGEATFFILYRILFVAKILCIILCWNIANLTSFVALNGRR